MRNKKKYLLFFFCLAVVLISCSNEENSEVPVKFQRYDKAVFSEDIPKLLHDYPAFTPFYFERIINIGNPSDSITPVFLQKFTATYKDNVYDSIQLVFPDMKKQEQELGKALGKYLAFFPTDSLPKFYTHFSGFNQAIIRTDNIISVSLENYLGHSTFYDKLGIYRYLRNGMFPDKIPIDIMKMLLFEKITPNRATENLLAAMIYQGKIYYCLKHFFPKKSLAFLLNYTEKQMQWCEDNEVTMWGFIVENKHLFSSDYRVIRSYIEPAPFTKYFPTESPGQTGIWIGYQIVKKYMEQTNARTEELLQTSDYQKILQKSAYNPE